MQTLKGKFTCIVFFVFLFTSLRAQRRVDYLELGKYELSESHFPKAIEHLNNYIKAQPYMYEGFFFRAYAKYELDDYLGAELDYTQAISLYPFLADIYNYRAIARDRLSDFNGAFEDYSKAISLDSSDAEIYLNRSITNLDLRQFNAAVADCNKAEELKLKDDNLYIIRGTALSEMNKYKESIIDYTKAIRMNPKDSRAYVQRGISLNAMAEKDSALSDFNYALVLDSNNAFAFFQKALMELSDSQYDAGLANLNKVIQLSPDCASAYFNRAILKSNVNDYYGALNDYNTVQQISPKNILVYYNRAALKEKNGDLAGALKDYDEAIVLYPDFADAYLSRSQIKGEMNNIKGATADENKGNKIKQMKSLEGDSMKLKDEMRLMKMMTLNDDFSTKGYFKEKVQYAPAAIQLQPIFTIVGLTDVNKRYYVYDIDRKQNGNQNTIVLTNIYDSVDTKKIQAKITQLDTLIDKNPSNASNYLDRAVLYSSLNLYNEAFSDYARSIVFDSTNALAYFSRANTRFKFLELLHSFDDNNSITKVSWNGQPSGSSTLTKYHEHTYEMVIKDYSKAIKLDPDFSYAWYNRASAKAQLNDMEGAMKDVAKALTCDSTLAPAYYNKGLLQILLHDNTEACLNLSKAGELGILESYYVMKKYCYK